MTSSSPQYLKMLRTEHPRSITIIIGLLLGGIMVWLPGIIVLTLVYGMFVRTQRCRAIPSKSTPLDAGSLAMLLFPLWPLLVSIDLVGDWMQEVGFGNTFQIAVTSLLFFCCWTPFIDWTLLSLGGILLAGIVSAILRTRGANIYAMLAPSLLPIGMVIQLWSR